MMLKYSGTILVLVVIIGVSISLGAPTKAPKEKVAYVSEAMERFVNDDQPSSGLTWDKLQEAYEEFKKWPEKLVNRAKKVIKTRLLIDLLFTPLDYFDWQFEDESDVRDMFIRRFEIAYKRFRTAYQGGQIGLEQVAAFKTNQLIGILIGRSNDELTYDHFRLAKIEYENWRARLDELTGQEDVYACLEELQRLLNYFHHFLTKTLAEVFAHVQPGADPAQLKQLFMDALEKQDFAIEDGKLIKYVNPGSCSSLVNPKMQQPIGESNIFTMKRC